MEVRLISGVADPLDWALRAIRKAHAKGLRLWVTIDRERWPRLMQHLCAGDPQAFFPMAPPGASAAVVRRSRIQVHWADGPPVAPPGGTHLLNLGRSVPVDLDRFVAVVDCVPAESEAAQLGRQRYRQYQQMGFTVLHTREGT